MTASPRIMAGADDKVAPEDLAAMVRGACGVLKMLQVVWPKATAGELIQKLEDLDASPTAVELFHVILTERKMMG
jgi:hypothetical protein